MRFPSNTLPSHLAQKNYRRSNLFHIGHSGGVIISKWIQKNSGIGLDTSFHRSITMGIRNMPWEDWIEVCDSSLATILIFTGIQLDDRFASYHRIRTHRIKTRGTNVVRILPNRPGVVRGGGQASRSCSLYAFSRVNFNKITSSGACSRTRRISIFALSDYVSN